ncbi:MAG: calcium/sodium antiporter [Candidatus Dadabacteria bacterium]|nr:calcium/sodium antiporter [Candidatus Dadabacteria bacterium]
MSITTDVFLFIAGIIALFLGGESLIKGASRLARGLGIHPIVIGLTVVGFGTSAPELVVCVIAALKGSSDIVLGNIVGSNIANIGLIMGLTALINPITIKMKLIKAEVMLMIILSITLYAVSWNLGLGRIEGVFFFGSLVIFIIYSYYGALRESYRVKLEYKEFVGDNSSMLKQAAFIVIGLALLVIGARFIVDSAISIATSFGISEVVIGIAAVAIGTSLPELATSTVAALRKENDIVVGNIIGSNIFNIGILGLVSVIRPVSVNPEFFKFEYPVMVLFAVLVLPVIRTGHIVSRSEGLLLLLLYVAFMFMLFVL